jgi:MoaA/NifB/PqqE/SkfB family radical SAM enzyme
MKNEKQMMSLGKFNQILDKIDPCHAIICLFNWTEPFLHPQIDLFVQQCHNRGYRSLISTNLSMKRIPLLEPTISAGLTKIIVSVSGFTKPVHRKNHFGSNIETVKEHLQNLASIKRAKSLKTNIDVHFLDFGYNKHEIPLFKEFCDELDVQFVVKTGRKLTEKISDTIIHSKSSALNTDLRLQPCSQIFKAVTIDCKGDAYLCCCMPSLPYYKIGSFLDMDFGVIQFARFTHPSCSLCNVKREQWVQEYQTPVTNALTSLAGRTCCIGTD